MLSYIKDRMRARLISIALILNLFQRISAWKKFNLFENCDVTFLSWPTGVTSRDKTLSYFTHIRQLNPYSPCVLYQFLINKTHQDILGRSKSPRLAQYKASRISVIFHDLSSDLVKEEIYGIPIYSCMQDLIITYLSPVYFIFQHVEFPCNNYCIRPRTIMAPVILFNSEFPDLVCIPCVSCDSMGAVGVSTTQRDFTISKI